MWSPHVPQRDLIRAPQERTADEMRRVHGGEVRRSDRMGEVLFDGASTAWQHPVNWFEHSIGGTHLPKVNTLLIAEVDVEELEARYDMEIEQQQQRIELQSREIQMLRSELDSIQQQTEDEANYVQGRVDKGKQRRAAAKAAMAKAVEESKDG